MFPFYLHFIFRIVAGWKGEGVGRKTRGAPQGRKNSSRREWIFSTKVQRTCKTKASVMKSSINIRAACTLLTLVTAQILWWMNTIMWCVTSACCLRIRIRAWVSDATGHLVCAASFTPRVTNMHVKYDLVGSDHHCVVHVIQPPLSISTWGNDKPAFFVRDKMQ